MKDLSDKIPIKEDESGRIKILERIGYKDGIILIRLFDEEIFVWDALWRGEIYGSHFIVKLPKKAKKHTEEIVREVRQMCYAGGGTTIDMLRGEHELDDKTKQTVEVFESSREEVEKESVS